MERLEGIRERAEGAAMRRMREDRAFEEEEERVREAGDHVRREFERIEQGRRSASPRRRDENIGNRPFLPPRLVEPAPPQVPQPQVQPQLQPRQEEPIQDNPPPVPVPAHQAQEDFLDSCPKCTLPFQSLSTRDAESHMRQCFDDGEGAHIESCPVCDTSLIGGQWDKVKAEKHVDDCCKALEAGGSAGGGGGGEKKGRGRREHVGQFFSSFQSLSDYDSFRRTRAEPRFERDTE